MKCYTKGMEVLEFIGALIGVFFLVFCWIMLYLEMSGKIVETGKKDGTPKSIRDVTEL